MTKTHTWPTFGRGLGAVRGDLPHAGAVATERHQAGNDGRLAEADVAHDDHARAGAGVELAVDLLEEPVAAGEHRVHGDAGHLEQQRLQGDVRRPVGCEAHCGEGGEEIEETVGVLQEVDAARQEVWLRQNGSKGFQGGLMGLNSLEAGSGFDPRCLSADLWKEGSLCVCSSSGVSF